MNVGRLVWRSPTGAILWEILGRRKWNFVCYGAGLVAAVICVHWIQNGASEIVHAVLRIFLLSMFMASCIDLLTCFGFIVIDAQRVQIGYPARLLLKPVGAAHLALTPMLFGGAAFVALLTVWGRILAPLLPANGLSPIWLEGVALSFFWWMQALGWGLPYFPARSLILLMAAVVHLLVGLIPLSSSAVLLQWRGLILGVMLLSAVLVAVHGLKWMRCGAWEGPSRFYGLWKRVAPALAPKLSKKFSSAFRAQFWLEWRRQGLVLPGMCSAITIVILPVVFLIQKQSIEPGQDLDFATVAAGMILLVPLMLSGAMGTAMARFDPVRPAGDLPVYISVRPMTNGDFVITKLAVALASSALTWLLMLVIGCLCLAILRKGSLVPAGSPYGFVGLVIGCLPALLLLILLTWNNLVSGIAAGLTGRPWMIGLFTTGKGLAGAGLVALIFAAKLNEDFRAVLLRWLLSLLCLCLTAKVAVSIASFHYGLRRKAITHGAVGWIVGGWLTCGAFVAGYAGLICQAVNKPGLWLWIALGGFLILPLTDFAIAPLAMAWNRHR